MSKFLLDTSVYIPLLRQGVVPSVLTHHQQAPLFLSAVVAQELLAGAGDDVTMKALQRFVGLFEQFDRLVVPAKEEWVECGKVLSRLGRRHGYESVKRGRLVNDVLIALSCAAIDATLVTANLKDFTLIQEFVRFNYCGPDLTPVGL